VISIRNEQRVDVLRQVALLLEQENHRLHARLHSLTIELARLQGRDGTAALQAELASLQELLARREKELFGDSSEKRPHSPELPAATNPSRPRKGHGPREQPQLPIVEVKHVLAESARGCPACGGELMEMAGQQEVSEEITVVERQFVMVQHQREKYRCRCNGAVVTAPGPRKLIPGGRYSAAFAVEVAVSKYLDHLPLERQSRMMEREGLVVSSQVLWDQIDALAVHLEASYQELAARVLSSPVIHADETHWRLMAKSERKKYWVWCLSSEDTAFYRILDSRSKSAAKSLLGDYPGIVIADGYGAYEALARAGPGFTLAHCWAHARRKFVEVEQHYPQPVREVLELIGSLYAVERKVPRAVGGELPAEAASRLALRAQLREESSRPLVEAIRQWAMSQRPLPQSGLGKAIHYLLGLWPGLTRFLEDPRIPLDNNAVERALRGVVVGRKNHYGSRSRRGCEVAALFYTLMESAKLCRIEPKRYLLKAASAALEQPGAVTLPQPPFA
jgi:transposase